MSSVFRFLFQWIIICILLLQSTTLLSQTVVTVGSGGNYTNLNTAFTAINTGVLTGNIHLQLISSTTLSATATLNATGTGGANYTSVLLSPTVAGIVITGNIAGPLIDLNGASNVTIDGRASLLGTANMILNNTNTSATAGNSTIRFINGANNNVIRFCVIFGATTSTTSGVVFFSTSTAVIGNHTNTLTDNSFSGSSEVARPVNVIFSSASSATQPNDFLQISNNHFFNFLHTGLASTAITFLEFTSSSTITGNSFFETTTFIPTANVDYRILSFDDLGSGNHTITNNFFGGNTRNAVGTWQKVSNTANSIYIIFGRLSNSRGSSIHGNVFRGWRWENNNNTSTKEFTALYLQQGLFAVGRQGQGNIIGAATGNGSITLRSAAAIFNFKGLEVNAATVDFSYNTIGSVTATNSDPTWGTMNLYGIDSGGGLTITNNIIGSTTTANSINADATCTSNNQMVFGININGGSATITHNTIANIRNGITNPTESSGAIGRINGICIGAGGATIHDNTIFNLSISNANNNQNENGSIAGISSRAVSSTKSIFRNTIYNLTNSFPTFRGDVVGIYMSGTSGVSSSVFSNFVHSLGVTGASSTAARLLGINLDQGRNVCHNNIIHLGGNTRTEIFGIRENGTATNNNNIIFNTVYISGTVAAGATNRSYALFSNASTNVRDFRNNILFNARATTSGSNLHYAVFYNYAVNTGLTTNFNNYWVTGVGGVVGFYNNTNHTMATLRTAIGQDANSLNINPQLTVPGGNVPANYIPLATTLNGISIALINHDFAGKRRLATPTIGAFELTTNSVEAWINNVLIATYPTMKTAFEAINTGVLTGNIQLRLIANTWEFESATLNASGKGNASYSQIDIFPTAANIIIRGNVAGPMISFDGASHVNIDGRVNRTQTAGQLTIMNESTANSAATSTIHFINDASHFTAQFCIIRGSQNFQPTGNTKSGVVFISNTTGTNGNDYITFDNCQFTTADATVRPRVMIYSTGVNTTVTNDHIVISNSLFFNFLSTQTQSAVPQGNANGILVDGFTSNVSVLNNSFFETTSLTVTGDGGTFTIVDVQANNSIVRGNHVGGTAALSGGSTMIKTGNNTIFRGFSVSGNNNIVEENVVRNISWTNTGNALFEAFRLGSSSISEGVVARNNIVGSTTSNGSIVFTGGTTGAVFAGFWSAGFVTH